jgi:hypothetical protein
MGYLGTDRSLGRSNGQVGMTSWVVNRCWQMETMLAENSADSLDIYPFLWVCNAEISRGIHRLQSIRSLDNGQVGIDYKCHWVTN